MSSAKVIAIAVLFLFGGLYGCSKKGDTGATGATGTANILYSSWNALNMTYNSTDSAYEQTITADSITQAVLDSGIVLSYIKYNNAANQVQVENASTYMEEVYALQSIQLYSYTYDFTGISFRYIVVHGGTSLSGGRETTASGLIRGYSKAEWQAMSYDKVTALLGIK